MARLIIDTKESAFLNEIEHFRTRGELKSVAAENLDVGDFWICRDGSTAPDVVVERKTVLDLIASLKDGRYANQKVRLAKFVKDHPNTRVIFLIEGFRINSNPSEHVIRQDGVSTGTPKSTIQSIFTKWMVRDGFHVHNVPDKAHSFWFLCRLTKNVADGKLVSTETPTEYMLSRHNYSRKTGMTPQNWFSICLSQIQGMSTAKAQILMKRYQTPVELVGALGNDRAKAENELAEIKVGGRRLGKVLSRRIYDYFHGISFNT